MAELTSFGFIAGDSRLHQLDARFKVICMIVISLVSLSLNFVELGIMTVILLAVILNARLPFDSGLKELRFFFLFTFLGICCPHAINARRAIDIL